MKVPGLAVSFALLGFTSLASYSGAQATATVKAVLESVSTRPVAPDFALEDTNGTIRRLTDYKGQVILLDFWATTCGGCVQEIPMLIQVAQEYRARGLTAIGVAEDIAYADLKGPREAWDRVRPFVRDHQVSYLVVMGDSRVTADYKIQALPLTHLVDRAGRIAATYHGVVDRPNLEANIRTLLSERR
jgi:cytochrome c biogenesis protein CcmG/thiol:disulfide interchange protein DsbE